MGHELARPVAAAALALGATVSLLSACGGGGDGDPPPALDNAREQVERASTVAEGPTAATTTPGPAELPAPDPATFEGANRVLNLWVGAAGETRAIDVWGRRTFTTGPILLAENVGFGEASDYFSAPLGYSIVIVNTGAGPDGVERAGVLNAATGEQVTTVFTNDDADGEVTAPNLFERGDPQAPEGAPSELGVVWFTAPNVRAYSDELIASIGGDAFYVGDGSETCRAQRGDPDNEAPRILGGTQTVELELAAGAHTVTLHPWFSPDGCAQPSVADIPVDVVPGTIELVVVFTRDGATIEWLTLPVADDV